MTRPNGNRGPGTVTRLAEYAARRATVARRRARPTDAQLLCAAVALEGCLFSEQKAAEYVAALAHAPGHNLESSAAMVRNYKDSVLATLAWLRSVATAGAEEGGGA